MSAVQASGLAERQAVLVARANQPRLNLAHSGGYKVCGSGGQSVLAGIVTPRKRILPILLAHHLLGLVDDHDLRSRLGDANHLRDGARLVTEEIDAADVINAIEDRVAKRQPLAFAMKQIRAAMPPLQVVAASDRKSTRLNSHHLGNFY